jgi:hypothetical protein
MRRSLGAFALPLALMALGLGGCGKQAERDPARAVPPTAAVYVWADLHPGGESGSSIRHVLGRVMGDGDDPGPGLRRIADQAVTQVGADLTWERDVAPWVGGRVGVFVTRFGPDFEGAFVASVRDAGAARRALARVGLPHEIADGVAIVGTPQAVAAARQASGGASLGTSDRYTMALSTRESPAAALYVDLSHLIPALPARLLGGAARRHDLELRFARIKDKPIVVSASGADDRIAVDFGPPPSPPDPSEPTPVGGGEKGTSLLPAHLIYSLPAQSWLALDLPELGQRLFETLSPTVNPGLPNLQLQALQRRFTQRTGVSPLHDVVSWIGATALFAYGTDPRHLGAGLVIESLDPARSRRTLAKARRLLPRSIAVLSRGNRVALANSPAAAVQALDAPVKLRSLPAFKSAAAQLGGSLLPSGWLVGPRAAAFLATTKAAQSPTIRATLPYLSRIAYVMLGVKRAKRRALIAAR